MKNKSFREYQSGSRQLLLNREAELAVRRGELQREIQRVASSLGWIPEDLQNFCVETFDAPFLLASNDELAWLLAKFKDVASAVASVPE